MTAFIAFLVANQTWLLPVAGAAGTMALGAAHARGYKLPILSGIFDWVHNTYPTIPPVQPGLPGSPTPPAAGPLPNRPLLNAFLMALEAKLGGMIPMPSVAPPVVPPALDTHPAIVAAVTKITT